MIGQTVAHYEITDVLGQGGMGVVYRARDTRLGRDVALKVLPEAVASDPDRLARFEREAQVLAALNHPNVAAIYGLEDAGDTRCLVLELVPGETLEERIARGPMGLEETLDIALGICRALESAHGAGIVHRDLKPANIKLPGGSGPRVKVLDFGLAKAMAPAAASGGSGTATQSPTLSLAATQAGMILGTAGYMSPEQARGQEADRRSDIWSFGVVLMEMLTGRRSFEGDTVADTLALVLTREPDLGALPAGVPTPIRRLLRRALSRDPERRLHDIADARIEIEEALAGVGEGTGAESGPALPVARGRRWTRTLPWALVAALGAVVVALWLGGSDEPTPRPVRRYALTNDAVPSFRVAPRLSPDGRRILYRAGETLWIRDLSSFEPREVPGSDDARAAFWSWDGSQIGWADETRIWRIPVNGSEPTPISDVPPRGILAGAWTRADRIVVAQWRGDLFELPSRGGSPTALGLIDPETEVDVHQLQVLPDGETLFYVLHDQADGEIGVIRAGRRQAIDLGEGRITTASFGAGHLLFQRDDQIWATRYAADTLRLEGDPFVLAASGALPTATDDTLAYVTGVGGRADVQLTLFDRTGARLGTIGEPEIGLRSPDASPGGDRVVVVAGEGDGSLWIVDMDDGTRTRLTFGDPRAPGDEPRPAQARDRPSTPVWSADAEWIYYQQVDAGFTASFKRKRADGTGGDELLATLPRSPGSRFDVSPDQRYLITADDVRNRRLVLLEIGKDSAWQVFHESAGRTADPVLSPDGRFVAFEDAESSEGEPHLYVRPFPSGDGTWQASIHEGLGARFSPDGSRLYFVSGQMLMEATFETDPVRIGPATPLFPIPGGFFGYDVLADPERFLLATAAPDGGGSRPSLVIVENWTADLPE